jgi:hypothetical protein
MSRTEYASSAGAQGGSKGGAGVAGSGPASAVQNDAVSDVAALSTSRRNRRPVRAGPAPRCPPLRRVPPGVRRRASQAGRPQRPPVRANARSPEGLRSGRFVTWPGVAKRVAIGCAQRGTTANPGGRKPLVFRLLRTVRVLDKRQKPDFGSGGRRFEPCPASHSRIRPARGPADQPCPLCRGGRDLGMRWPNSRP